MDNKYARLQQDISILLQDDKDIRVKLEVLNSDDKIIQTIEGVCTDAPFSFDAGSDVRSSMSLTLFVINSSYTIGEGKIFWFDKRIRAYFGIRYTRNDTITYYQLGEYLTADGSFLYSAESNHLTVNLSDKMCLLNGELGGYINTQVLTIESGEDIRTSIIGILNLAGIDKYIIDDLDRVIPYDKEYTGDITYYDVIRELLDLYSEHEMFFDVNGIFTIRKIPKGLNDGICMDDTIITPLLISENSTFSLTNIYNHIIVYGQTIEADYYSDACTYSDGVYSATITSVSGYTNFSIYAIAIPNNSSANDILSINGLPSKNIMYDDDVRIRQDDMSNGIYCFKYRSASDDFLLLGEYQAYGEARCTDDSTPFSISKIGDRVKILSGGEYEDIYSNSLANQRAKYELYNSTCLQETLDMEMILVPWLNVNYKFSHAVKYNEEHEYLIQGINGNLADCTMNVTSTRYYPEYAATL